MNTSGSSYDEGPVLKVNTTEFKGGIWCEIRNHRGRRNRRDSWILSYRSRKGCNSDRERRHLEAMQKQGLTMRQLWDGKEETIPVKACRMEEYTEQPDVILVCVKGYSLTDLIPDIRRIAGPGDSSSSNPEYLWNRRQITERISRSHRTGWMHLCISGNRGAGE